MLRSFAENIRSFWSMSTDFGKEKPRRKRKHSTDGFNGEDQDLDIQVVKVEKRIKLDDHTSSASGFFHKMADWVRPKQLSFAEKFTTRPRSKDNHASEVSVTHENGRHLKKSNHQLPWMNGQRHVTDRQNNSHRSHVPGVEKYTAEMQDHRTTSTKASFPRRPSDSSSIFGSKKRFAASDSVRLKEREQYLRILQTQTQYPLFAPRNPIGTSGASAISGNDRSLLSTSTQPQDSSHLMSQVKAAEMSKMHAFSSLLSRQRIKAAKPLEPQSRPLSRPSLHRSGASVTPPGQLSPPLSPGGASNVTLTWRQRRSIASELRDHRREVQTDISTIVVEDDDSGDAIQQQKEMLPSSAKKVPEVISVDDDDEGVSRSKGLYSHLPSRSKENFSLENSKSQTYYKRCQAQIEEKERRRRLIEEEEMKAHAYEEKRRLQVCSLERQMKYKMAIFDHTPEVTEEMFVSSSEEEEEEESLPELTDEMLDTVRAALRPGNPNDVLSDAFRLQVTRRDMATLAGLNWLNDEVINFYMNMLMERGEQEGKAKVHAFNTFFYPKIMSGGHASVKRWTKKVDIFAVHFIVIPVHLGMHWCLCVADMQEKKITYYDSMGATNNKCLQAVLNYINDESVAKKQTPIDKNDWILVNDDEGPQQMNGSDCGMFMCKSADYITRQKERTFNQEDMPYFRQRMVYEIITKKLLQ